MTTDDLPDILPIFPLNGVLLLPRGQLPLNIFEPRYLAMIDEALQTDRLIGMIQPKNLDKETGPDDVPVYETGCAGRIVSFEETNDNRYMVTLKGLSRFRVRQEVELKNGFRRVEADWSSFEEDLEPQECLGLDRGKLMDLLEPYFEKQGMTCSADMIDGASDEKLITCLSMVCPLDAGEKQALLEAGCCKERASMFLTLLEIAVKEHSDCCGSCH